MKAQMREDVAHARRPLPLQCVRAEDWLAERLERARLAMDNFGACLCWDTSAWGYEAPLRWLRNMSLFYSYSGVAHPRIPEVYDRMKTLAPVDKARRLHDKQNPLMVPGRESQFIYGMLDYYLAFSDADALETAEQVARNIVTTRTDWSQWYYMGISLPPLVTLAALTGDSVVLKGAQRIADQQQLSLLNDSDVHGAAGTRLLRGYVLLYEQTGEARYLEWAEKGWTAIRERMWVTGGIGELLDFTAAPSESHLHGETCQTVDWFLLTLNLWRTTGERSYLELCERIFYNQFMAHMLHRGEGPGFTAMNDIEQGFRGNHNYICCDNEGTLGLLRLLPCLFSHEEQHHRVTANFLMPAVLRFAVQDREVSVRLAPAYPVQGQCRAEVRTPTDVTFDLALRIPGKRRPVARVNGRPVDFRWSKGHLCVKRTWKDRDSLQVLFPMAMKVETDNTGKGPRSGKVRIRGKTERATQARVRTTSRKHGLSVKLTGAAADSVPVFLPAPSKLRAGHLLVGERRVSPVLRYDRDRLVAVVDVPATYRVARHEKDAARDV